MTKNRIFKSKHDWFFYISLMLLPCIQFFIFYIVVNFNSILLVFQKFENGKFVFNGFNNFVEVFTKSSTINNITINSLLTYGKKSLIAYVFQMVFGFPFAIMFSFYIAKKYKGSGFFKVIIYLPHMVSATVFVLMFKIFSDGAMLDVIEMITGEKPFLGITKGYPFELALIYTIWSSFGVNVLLYTGAMSQISDSIVESAQLDGITPFKEMILITIPLIYPTIVTFLVVGLAGIFTNQMNLYTFYGEFANDKAKTLGYFMYATMKSSVTDYSDYPYLATLGIVLTAITMAITFGARAILNRLDPMREY